ncbi:MAG: DUF1816 domain-containing protein [Cyanobacteria bacterium P01_F01_bin.3]
MKKPLSQPTSQFLESWWVELSTQSPRCDYYFGPFASHGEAVRAQPGYVEDLEQEGSEVLTLSVLCRRPPEVLTVEYPAVAWSKAYTV